MHGVHLGVVMFDLFKMSSTLLSQRQAAVPMSSHALFERFGSGQCLAYADPSRWCQHRQVASNCLTLESYSYLLVYLHGLSQRPQRSSPIRSLKVDRLLFRCLPTEAKTPSPDETNKLQH